MNRAIDSHGVALLLPDDWTLRQGPKGIVFACPKADEFHELQFLTISIAFVLYPSHVPVRQFADKLMSSRVAQGTPDVSFASLDGKQSIRYDWTDGLHRIISWFAVSTRGIVEIQASRLPMEHDEPNIAEWPNPFVQSIQWI